MSEERWLLPKAWEWVKAGEIAEIVGGGTPPSKDIENFQEDGIPWLTPADLTGYKKTYISRGRRDLSQKGYNGSGAKIMPKGAVLFSSRAPIGYCVIASNQISTNQGFKSLVLIKDVIPEFVRHYLISSKEYAESLASGTTFKELSGKRMSEMPIPIAPLNEQRRIVAKLDSLFARSRRAREELERIPKLCDRYRQAVLAAAFRGDLTAEWRKDKASTSTAKDFLVEVGIQPIEESSPSFLPDGWAWVLAGNLCNIKSGVALGKRRAPGTHLIELPYLRVANVQRGWLDLREIKTVLVTPKEAEFLYLAVGDILMNEGGDRDKLGRGWIWDGQIENCIHQNHVFRLRPKSNQIPSRYVSYYANEFGQSYFMDQGKQTTNLASISMSKLSNFPIPVASPEEMKLIIKLIEKLFRTINLIEQEYQRASKLCDRLEQATLAKAFRGELVPQDWNDEPASVLLERIQAEQTNPKFQKRERKASENPLNTQLSFERM